MNTILLFGMPGGGELFFIVLIIIMLFGSKKIPELARGLGKGMREIKNATGEIQREIRAGVSDIDSMKDSIDIEKQVKDLIKGDKEQQEAKKDTDETSSKIKKESSLENNEQDITQSQTVKRKSPYAKEEPQKPAENV